MLRAWSVLIVETGWLCISKAPGCEKRAKTDKLLHSVPYGTDGIGWYRAHGESWGRESFCERWHWNFLAKRLSEIAMTRNPASLLTEVLLLLQWFSSPWQSSARDNHLHNDFSRGTMHITRHLFAKPFETVLSRKPLLGQPQITQKHFFSYSDMLTRAPSPVNFSSRTGWKTDFFFFFSPTAKWEDIQKNSFFLF